MWYTWDGNISSHWVVVVDTNKQTKTLKCNASGCRSACMHNSGKCHCQQKQKIFNACTRNVGLLILMTFSSWSAVHSRLCELNEGRQCMNVKPKKYWNLTLALWVLPVSSCYPRHCRQNLLSLLPHTVQMNPRTVLCTQIEINQFRTWFLFEVLS